MDRPCGKRLWVCALVAFAASLGRHAPFASEPFEDCLADYNTARVQGAIQKSYERIGFLELRGRPVVRPVPTDPPDGRTYGNHPPLLSWINYGFVRLLGLSELSVRAWAMLACALSAAVLAATAARLGGTMAGLIAALVFAALPATFFHGRMSGYESPVLMLGAATLALHGRGRTTAPRIALACGLLVVAVWHDWVGAFFVPATFVLALAARRRPFPWASVIVPGLSVTAAVFAYLFLLSLWEGGLEPALDLLRTASATAGSSTPRYDLARFLRAQGDHVVSSFGWPGALVAGAAVAGAVAAALRRPREWAGHLLAWTTVTVLNVGLFPQRAYDHDFWWYYLTPVVVLATALGAARSIRWGRPPAATRGRRVLAVCAAASLVGAVVAGGIVPTVRRHAEEQTGNEVRLATGINRFLDEKTMLVTQDTGAWYFYARPWVFDYTMRSTDTTRYLYRRFRAGLYTVDHFVVICDANLLAAHPGLADEFRDLGLIRRQLGYYSAFVGSR